MIENILRSLNDVIKRVSRLERIEKGGMETLSAWVTSASQNPSMGNLPADTYVFNVRMHPTEAFNSDGTDEIRVGYDGVEAAFATLTDVSTTGVKTVTLGASAGYNATARAVEAYYVNGGTEPTTGKALVILEYYRVVTQP